MLHHSQRSRTLAVLIGAAMAISTIVVFTTPGGAPARALPTGGDIVSVGSRSACAVLSTGTIECWGDNNAGVLGRGTDSGPHDPGPVSGIDDAVSVAVGSSHACALRAGGTVMCWGEEFHGALGNGMSGSGSTPALTPIPVDGLAGVAQIVTGSHYSCALLDDGTVKCWGDSTQGLGGSDAVVESDVPVAITGLDDAVDITAGNKHACAVNADGTARCWGTNSGGQLGDGTTTASNTPVPVDGLAGAVRIDAGFAHTCVATGDAAVWCWGANGSGQLGDENAPNSSPVPVLVSAASGAVDIAAGQGSTCAVLATGDRICWGTNDRGELGDGTTTDSPTPTVVSGSQNFESISGGTDTYCATTDAGNAWCWGDNDFDQADGNGVRTNESPAPFQPGTPDAIVSGDNNICTLTAGTPSCTGLDENNQLRDGGGISKTVPVALTDVGTIAELDIGLFHMCGRRDVGTVACWGSPNSAQLGGAGVVDFVEVGGLADVLDISVGTNHTCVIENETPGADSVYCWGSGSLGQIGDGDNGQQTFPALVSRSWLVPTSISAGNSHTCAIDDQEVFCWGNGTAGQLGDGNSTSSNVPVEVDYIGSAQVVAAGDSHTCAIIGSGQVQCWGFSVFTGGFANHPTPVDMPITNAVDLVASDGHTCALLDDQTVTCWGFDLDGRLGNGPAADSSFAPTVVPGLTNVLELSGGNQTCARTTIEIVCWGANDHGEMGTLPYLLSPDLVALSGEVPGTTTTTTTTTTSTTSTSTTSTTVPTEPIEPPTLFSPVAPARLVDTRPAPTGETVDGEHLGRGRLDAGDSITIDVAGRAQVPDDAAAAIVNVTAIRPDGVGFVTLHPCLDPPPTTSSLNYAAGVSLGNEVIVELDSGGNACLFTSAATDVSVDVVAYLPTGSDYTAAGPARLADTRTNSSAETIDGAFLGDGTLAAGTTYEVQITNRAGVPVTARAAVVNVTAIKASGVGYFTVHPCLTTPPNAASLNYTAGSNRGNEIIAPLSPDGSICVFSSASTDLAVDVVGHVSDAAYTPVSPARLLETRTGATLTTADGKFEGEGKRAAFDSLTLDVAGRVGVPSNVKTVTINVTAIAAEAIGFATVHPCLPTAPNAASLNFVPGVNGGNEIVAEVDTNGQICIFTSAAVHLTADIAGYTT